MTKVSVVIPTFKRKNCLVKLLKSLNLQTYKNYEIIVVDQNSPPLNLSQFSNVTHLKFSFPSITKSKNLGVRKSSGDIILTLDDDLEISDNLVELHVSKFTNSGIGAVGGLVVQKVPKFSGFSFGFYTIWGELGIKYDGGGDQFVEATWGGNLSFRREVFNEIGGFDENFIGNSVNEDSDFCLRINKAGYRVLFTPDIKVKHLRALGGSRSQEKKRWYYELFYNHLYFYLKHFPKICLPLFFTYRLRQVYSLVRDCGIKSLPVVFKGYYGGFKAFRSYSQLQIGKIS